MSETSPISTKATEQAAEPEAAQVLTEEQQPKQRRIIISSAMALGAFSLLTMGLVFVFYFNTEERIATSQSQYEQFILREIVGLDEVGFMPQVWTNRKTGDKARGYLILPGGARGDLEKTGKHGGMILETITLEGYSGSIELLVGIDADERIIAVGVTKHSETPGLGDKIERGKSAWINQFNGKSLDKSNWNVKKDAGDFDSLSGATISSRAVVKAVEGVLQQLGNIDKLDQLENEQTTTAK